MNANKTGGKWHYINDTWRIRECWDGYEIYINDAWCGWTYFHSTMSLTLALLMTSSMEKNSGS